jgi:hypothetical protein
MQNMADLPLGGDTSWLLTIGEGSLFNLKVPR